MRRFLFLFSFSLAFTTNSYAEILITDLDSKISLQISEDQEPIKFPTLEMAQKEAIARKYSQAIYSVSFTAPSNFSLCKQEGAIGLMIGRIYDQSRIYVNEKLVHVNNDPKVSDRMSPLSWIAIPFLPDEICNKEITLRIEIKALIGARQGFLRPNDLRLGLYEDLAYEKLLTETVYSVGKDIGLITFAVGLFVLVVFWGCSNSYEQKVYFFLTAAASMLGVTLSGWAHPFFKKAIHIYKLNALVSTTTCILLLVYILSLLDKNSILKRRIRIDRILPYLIFINFPIFILSNTSNLMVLYKYELILMTISNLIAAFILFLTLFKKSSVGDAFRILLVSLMVFGIMSDVARFLGFHSMPNITNITFGIGLIGIGVNYALHLKKIFQNAAEKELMEFRLSSMEHFSLLAKQVAHDIRGPLSALNIIFDDEIDPQDAKKKLAKKAVKRINDISNDLLKQGIERENHAAANAPPKTYNMVVSQIYDLVEEVRQEKLLKTMNSQCNIVYSGSTNTIKSKVDPTHFKRLLSNLLENSIEASKDREGDIFINLENDSENLTLSIRDKGKGMSESLVQSINDGLLLSQSKSFNKDSGSGSGLGLPHARKCIIEFGGSLRVSSIEGLGTKIQIILPLATDSRLQEA
ncbi:MAG: ATP-binding protein [Pseudobdellovibrionaceae bacterium]